MASPLSSLRNSFIGLTDKYLDSALLGADVIDIMGGYIDEHDKDRIRTRLDRYRKAWEFYRGEQWRRTAPNGERKATINVCKKIVNKSTDWLFGRPFQITAPPGNEEVASLCESVWEDNEKESLCWRLGQFGGVCGDAVAQVTTSNLSRFGTALPNNQQRIVIRLLPPKYVHPVYDSVDSGNMIAVLIQFPVRIKESLDNSGKRERPYALYSQYVTPDKIYEYINRDPMPGSPTENKLGEINIVHIRNCYDGERWSGTSDIEDIFDLQEDLNSLATDLKNIIEYHASPTTLVYGAKASTMEKGHNKVWSGLPKDARVENLELKGNLDASRGFLEFMENHIFELAGVPKKAFAGDTALANVSGAALQTALMPLVEKTERKKKSYGPALQRINRLIVRYHTEILGKSLKISDKERQFDTKIMFGNPLPVDERERMEKLRQRLDLGLESRIGALRELYPDRILEKTIEILSDRRQDFAEDIERSRASDTGTSPNLSVFSLGSLALSQGLFDVFEEIDALLLEKSLREKALQAAGEAPLGDATTPAGDAETESSDPDDLPSEEA